MNEGISETAEPYVTRFEAHDRALGDALPGWWMERKRKAASLFSRSGFPHPRHEEWKYTNVRPLTKRTFAEPPEAPSAEQAAEARAAVPLPTWDSLRLWFVDGRFVAAEGAEDQPKVSVAPLNEALQRDPARWEPHLGQIASDSGNSFVNLNTALTDVGAAIHVGPNTQVKAPIHLIFVSTAGETPWMTHPRIVMRAEQGSEVTLVEQYRGMPQSGHFTNPVTELSLGANATVDHYLIKEESDTGYLIESLHAELERDSRLRSHNLTLGGRLARSDLNLHLRAEGAEVELYGAFLVRGRQHSDNHTRVFHHAPRTRSTEVYRGIADDHSRGVFKGVVVVDPHAQKIEAHQSSDNLLVAETAEIDTKPELQIYADDVACSHGATVGQLDERALYYLRSRGIDKGLAQSLLINGFVETVFEAIRSPMLRDHLETQVCHYLPDCQRLKGLE